MNQIVKSYIYCLNQLLGEKRHKKWNQECKRKHYLLFNFCNIFDLLTSRTQVTTLNITVTKYHGDPLLLDLMFRYFSITNSSGKIKEISSTSFYCIKPLKFIRICIYIYNIIYIYKCVCVCVCVSVCACMYMSCIILSNIMF